MSSGEDFGHSLKTLIAKKLLFLMKTLNMRNLVCPEENTLKTFKLEDLLFLFHFLLS